ncbi:MAG: hypothetical protein V1813_03475 [Candidatus Aenigmatarchaeota archaeon]
MKTKKKPVRGKPGSLLLLVLAMAAMCTSAAAFAAYYVLFQVHVYEVIEFPMEVYVDNIAGFNVETDIVNFGIVPPGGSSGRKMTVTAGDFRTLVTLESSGDIAEWVTVSKNNILLESGANATVMIDVTIPDDVVPLAYRSGTLRIVFRKA